jgi:hypothetical protein
VRSQAPALVMGHSAREGDSGSVCTYDRVLCPYCKYFLRRSSRNQS